MGIFLEHIWKLLSLELLDRYSRDKSISTFKSTSHKNAKKTRQYETAFTTIIFNHFPLQPLKQTISEENQHTSNAEPNKSPVTRSSSSPFPTPNGFKFEELTKELDKMLKYCQESLPSCHPPELAHLLKFLEHTKALNKMMLDATDSRTPNKDDEPEIAEMKKVHRARHKHTDQTIWVTKNMLSDPMASIYVS